MTQKGLKRAQLIIEIIGLWFNYNYMNKYLLKSFTMNVHFYSCTTSIKDILKHNIVLQ